MGFLFSMYMGFLLSIRVGKPFTFYILGLSHQIVVTYYITLMLSNIPDMWVNNFFYNSIEPTKSALSLINHFGIQVQNSQLMKQKYRNTNSSHKTLKLHLYLHFPCKKVIFLQKYLVKKSCHAIFYLVKKTWS